MTLFTEEYKTTLENTHKQTKYTWGQTAPMYIREISHFIKQNNIKDVLDYGSSWGSLKQTLEKHGILKELNTLQEYDPGYPNKVNGNIPQEFVICIDVLEHIEPELIDNVLDDLQRCTLKAGFFTIATYKARQILSDGRNAHLIVEPPLWWKEKLVKRFEIVQESYNGNTYKVYVGKKL